jgi:hypothetical protein
VPAAFGRENRRVELETVNHSKDADNAAASELSPNVEWHIDDGPSSDWTRSSFEFGLKSHEYEFPVYCFWFQVKKLQSSRFKPMGKPFPIAIPEFVTNLGCRKLALAMAQRNWRSKGKGLQLARNLSRGLTSNGYGKQHEE